MSTSDIYKNHWQNQKHLDAFIAFKKFTLWSEEDFATQCAQILAGAIPQEKIKLLDIGVGDGLVTNFFLTELSQHKSITDYLGIELSVTFVEQAMKKLQHFKSLWPIEVQNADALVFQPEQQMDLIVAFNSWYGIPFERIVDFRQALTTNGVLAILLNSESNLTIDVTSKFKPEEIVTSSEQLMRWLDSHGVNYQSHLITTQFANRNDFLSTEGLRKESVGFFEYLLRGDIEDPQAIANYISGKPDAYFNLPQHLITISQT